MVTFPMTSLSMVGSIGTGIIEFPGLGLFIAVFLMAALVGSALGMLRELGTPYADSAVPPNVAVNAVDRLESDSAHRVAA
jgi:hypothetical protein